tara:strand:- start:1608 stop:1760 length:153 start_codon:yes stop_codon:yes gene_type:complete
VEAFFISGWKVKNDHLSSHFNDSETSNCRDIETTIALNKNSIQKLKIQKL